MSAMSRRFPLALKALLPLVLAILVFLLLEPIFLWNWGWEALPEARLGETTEAASRGGHRERFLEAEERLRRAAEEGQLPSVSAAVALDGEILWAGAVGHADLGEGKPATLRTQYRIGSTSKPITATVAARMVAEGTLDLDRPVDAYVPYFPAKEHPVTVRQLLSHTAGIRHYGLCPCFPVWEFASKRPFETVEAAVGVFGASPLLFEPGTGFSYSSYGTVLASAALEGAAGRDFLELVELYLAGPLGLAHTRADLPVLDQDHRARPYEVDAGRYKEAYPVDLSMKWAGGGFVSTPSDLVRLGSAWLSGDFLPDEIRREFWTPQKLASGEVNEQSYALGWRSTTSTAVFGESRPLSIVHHAGTAKGGTSSFVLYPAYGVAVSVVTNRSISGDHLFWNLQSDLVRDLLEGLEAGP